MFEASKIEDSDPDETREWLESIDSVLRVHGAERAHFLLERLIDHTRRSGAYLPFTPNTAYVNTISDGAAAGVSRATAPSSGASRPTSAGTRWRWWCRPTGRARELRRPHRDLRLRRHALRSRLQPFLARAAATRIRRRPGLHPGPLVAGHLCARLPRGPARARSSCDNFRQEVERRRPVVLSAPVADAGLLAVPDGVDGPRADHGDLPGALHALPGAPRPHARRATARSGPSSATARWTSPSRSARITLPAREKLDNLVFVVNCNLQRLDGPVRGNGKIIQELEAALPRRRLERHQGASGAATGIRCSPRTSDGLLRKRMEECVDGEYQNFKAKGGAYTREHFFGKYPELTRDGRQHVRRRHLAPQPRRPRPAQGLRRLRRRRWSTRASRR